MALPSNRAPHCAWTCFKQAGHHCLAYSGATTCAMQPIHLMATRLEGRKGPTYEDRKILPPLGKFKEKRNA